MWDEKIEMVDIDIKGPLKSQKHDGSSQEQSLWTR